MNLRETARQNWSAQPDRDDKPDLGSAQGLGRRAAGRLRVEAARHEGHAIGGKTPGAGILWLRKNGRINLHFDQPIEQQVRQAVVLMGRIAADRSGRQLIPLAFSRKGVVEVEKVGQPPAGAVGVTMMIRPLRVLGAMGWPRSV
jgi:hypothetical protein